MTRFQVLSIRLFFLTAIFWNCSGLAASKRKPNKAKGKGGKKGFASNLKGFGAAPPSLEEVAAKFKTRLPEKANILPCPCGSGDLYEKCCEPYHAGKKYPETPTKVLQSRYTAFTYRLIPYIIETTHPTCRDYRE